MTRAAGPLPALALGAAVGLLSGALLVSGLAGSPGITDTPVYQRYGEAISGGAVPYRDFRVEYPPGALPAFVVPAVLTASQDDYDAVFAALMIGCLGVLGALVVLCLRLLQASPTRIVLALATLGAGLLLLGPFVLTRFDLVPAALVAGALAAALGGRERLAALTLGAAVAVKLYPAVLVPLFVARAWRRRGRSEAIWSLGLSAGVVLLLYTPFLLSAPAGVGRSLWYQLGRPLQIESLGSALLLAFHHTVSLPLGWASGNGSQNLTGRATGAVADVTAILTVAALLAISVAFARGEPSQPRLVRHAAAALVAFVAFGKVLSPQYLVWLLPVVVLVGGRRGVAAGALLVAACALTRGWFPGDYWALVRSFDERASWLVLARDLVLAALFVVLAVPRARAPAPARSPSPAPSPGRT